MMCFSDFPMPDDYPNYLHHSLLLQYLRLYAQHFDLLQHIHFQTTVRSVTQRPDRWDVVTVNKDGNEERHEFDAVLVCSGLYRRPVLPLSELPGIETFTGRYFHSWEYKDAEACRGKRVLVVGIGNSGGDIAVEISRVANKTFLSTREGAWVISRMTNHGLPMDIAAITRFNSVLMETLPQSLINWAAEKALNRKLDHKLYGLKPAHRLFEKSTLNDDLPGRLLQGALVTKSNLKGFKDSRVFFDDGTVEENVDVVVFCTGYTAHFPFLPTALAEGPHGEMMLYKRMFPSSLESHTLAIIGFFQAKGPIMPIAEMQARWALRVFTGSCRLPPKDEMLAVIQSERKKNSKRFPCPRTAALMVSFVPYMDFLAEQVGARPNCLTLLLRDPVLWAKVFFGPCTPYQYRLTGPGQWAGARHAILTQWERVAQPFRTRAVPEPANRPSVVFCPRFLIFGGTVMIVLLLSKNMFLTALQQAAQMMDSSGFTG